MGTCGHRQEQAELGGGWDAEWVGAYTRNEEQQRIREEAESRRWQQRRQWGPGGGAWGGAGGQGMGGRAVSRDPRGYYRTLGVEPGASKEDIQV